MKQQSVKLCCFSEKVRGYLLHGVEIRWTFPSVRGVLFAPCYAIYRHAVAVWIPLCYYDIGGGMSILRTERITSKVLKRANHLGAKEKAQPQGLCFFSLVAEMEFEPHDLPHRSHSCSASLDTLAPRTPCSAVSTVVKTTLSCFNLGCRLFALRSLCDIGLITSKVLKRANLFGAK